MDYRTADPNHPAAPWSLFYSSLLQYFKDGGNTVDVASLWFSPYKISGILLGSKTIWIDNTHENVWCGAFNLQAAITSQKAISAANIPDGDPNSPILKNKLIITCSP